MTDLHSWNQERATLAANLADVRAHIAQAADSAGRRLEEVTLVAVSKTKPLELIRLAYELGVRDFGENRVQEALGKITDFAPDDLRWHMIGHVQTNKAPKVVGPFACIHSVDSVRLAELLEYQAAQQGRVQPVLLEVNVAGEQSKTGMTVTETLDLAHQCTRFPHLEMQGLMTVAPLVEDVEEVRPVFRTLRLLREQLRREVPHSKWPHLSMGMTDDYRIAIEEGATIVRIGRAIFGARVKKGEHNEN